MPKSHRGIKKSRSVTLHGENVKCPPPRNELVPPPRQTFIDLKPHPISLPMDSIQPILIHLDPEPPKNKQGRRHPDPIILHRSVLAKLLSNQSISNTIPSSRRILPALEGGSDCKHNSSLFQTPATNPQYFPKTAARYQSLIGPFHAHVVNPTRYGRHAEISICL